MITPSPSVEEVDAGGVTAALSHTNTVSAQYSSEVPVTSLRRLAVRGAAYVASSRLIIQIFTWFVTIETARLLRPYDYGILSAAAVLTNLTDVLAEAGLGKALVQKPKVDANDQAEAFTLSFVLSVAMYALLLGGAAAAATGLQTPELATVLPVVGLTLLLIPLRVVPMSILERDLRLKCMAGIAVCSSVLQGSIVLALALAGFGYWALILGFMVPRFLEVPFVIWKTSWVPRFRWPGGWSNPLVSFGTHYTGARLCWFVYRNADYVVVGRLLGPIALGFYSLAFMLISLPVEKIVATCNQAAFPTYCRLRNDRQRIRDWYLRLSILFGFVATPVLVGLAVVANDAIVVVLGEKWIPAVVPLQIMSLAGVFMVLGSSIDVLFNAMGRPDINFRFTAISVVVYPVLFYISALHWGVSGVAWVWAIFYPIMVLVLIGTTRSLTGVRIRDLVDSQFAFWTSSLLMAMVVLGVQYLLRDSRGTVRLPLSILAGVLGYMGAVWILAWERVMGNLRLLWNELRSHKVQADQV